MNILKYKIRVKVKYLILYCIKKNEKKGRKIYIKKINHKFT